MNAFRGILIHVFWLTVCLYISIALFIPINKYTAPYLVYVDLSHDVVMDNKKHNWYCVYSEVGFYRRIFLFNKFIERTELEIKCYVPENEIELVKAQHEEKLKREFEDLKKRFDAGFGSWSIKKLFGFNR